MLHGLGNSAIRSTSFDGSAGPGSPRQVPQNRKLERVDDCASSDGDPSRVRTKPKRHRSWFGWVAGVGAWFRTKAQGFRALASVAFVVAASVALAWGIKQHVASSPRFAVKTIRVEGTSRLTPEQVSEAAGVAIGMNVFSIDLDAARRRILQDPWIATAEIGRTLPSKLTISVSEREASGVVAVDADLYLCTPEGELFKKLEVGDPIGLVVVSGVTASLVANDRKLAVSRIRSALELVGQYDLPWLSQRYPVQEVRIADDGTLRLIVGRDPVALDMGRGPYRIKVQRAARVLREVQAQKAVPSVVFLDNEAHPERVVV
ncbi:MAG: FtsQ-type POTRA domain-containing protein, partial [Polyangiaceae bacterium]|nr:FtsQ-type POTRA domain-containing protein [Polyangiaceae bacterium]